MPKHTPGETIATVVGRERKAEQEEPPAKPPRKTKPRKDDAGLISVRLPAEMKRELQSHVAALQAQGVEASINSLIRALAAEYLAEVEAGTREPPVVTTTQTKIGV